MFTPIELLVTLFTALCIALAAQCARANSEISSACKDDRKTQNTTIVLPVSKKITSTQQSSK